MDAERVNWLAKIVLDYAFEIHSDVGAGLLESVYCRILADCLRSHGLEVQEQEQIPIVYKGKTYGHALRADLIVEDALIVEVKCMDQLHAVHHKQLLTYLRLTGYRLGILLNFGARSLKDGIKRIVNEL